MAKTKRCPKCGAANPESAQWCSLCLERFVTEEERQPVAVSGTAAKSTTESAIPESPAAAPSMARATADAGAFEVTEDGIRWVCSTCGTANAIDASVCAVCGATFADTVRPKAEPVEGDPGKAALFSLFFPGGGHAYLGMWGQAVARAVLSLWVLLVAIVGLLDKDVPGSLAMAGIFGLAALALWVLAAHDAFREATNDPGGVILKGRRFLYLVLGLMALLFVVMLSALMAARGRAQNDAISIRGWRSTSSPISTELPTI